MLGGLGGLYSVFFRVYGPTIIALFIAGKPTISIASKLVNMDAKAGKEENLSKLEKKLYWRCCVTRWLCFPCCRESKFDRRVKQGAALVNQELDITQLLRRLHVIESAFRDTMSPDQWRAKWESYEKIQLPEGEPNDENDDAGSKEKDFNNANRVLIANSDLDIEMVRYADSKIKRRNDN